MILKVLLISGLFLLYFLMRSNGKEREYFYLTVLMLVMREMNVSWGSITPSTVMVLVLLLGSFSRIWKYFHKYMTYIFTLLLAVLIGFVTTNFDYGRVTEWAWLLASIVIISSLCQYFIRSEEDLRSLTTCILIVCFIFSITTIMAFHGFADGEVIYSGFDASSDADDIHSSRVYGITFSNLVQVISVISICLLPSYKMKRKWMEYLLIAVFVYAALVTLKRMTFIALAFTLLYYLRRQHAIRNYRTIWIVAILCVALIIQWWDAFMFRFGIAGFGTGDITDHSTQSRFDRIDYALEFFEQSPILGMGAGYAIYIHNGFFEILANCGIIGICTIFFRWIPRIKDLILGNPYAVSAFIYLLTCVSLESAVSKAQTIYFLGLFLGGYLASKKIENQKRISTI